METLLCAVVGTARHQHVGRSGNAGFVALHDT